MKRKNRPPVRFVTEGLGPRRNEITRWSYTEHGRQWMVIVYIHAQDEQDLIYEIGPVEGGHWGHDAHRTSQPIADFLSSRAAPDWSHAPKLNIHRIEAALEARTGQIAHPPASLEQELSAFLSSLKDRGTYENWSLYDKPCSLTRLGKYGDEFEPGLLVGSNRKDLRVILLVERAGATPEILVAVVNSDNVLARFNSVAQMRGYLAGATALPPRMPGPPPV